MASPAFITKRPSYSLEVRGRSLVLGGRTFIMGIVNATPDSFANGGRFAEAEDAVAQGLALFEAGADIVDVGGESTRPGGAPVGAEQERQRVVPVIEGLRRWCGDGLVSVDTTKAVVARAALDSGADLVNDVSGFRFDPELARLVAERGVPAVAMHLRGDFETMHSAPSYGDVMAEIASELRESVSRATRAGVRPERLIVDPGIGFAKNVGQSLEALRRLGELHALGRPILVGPSRKSFIGKVLDLPASERLFGTAAAVAACVLLGAHVVRVHDVKEMTQVVRVCDAILGGAA